MTIIYDSSANKEENTCSCQECSCEHCTCGQCSCNEEKEDTEEDTNN